MTTFIVTLELNADFYREEFANRGRKALLKELKREIKDQVVEYDLDQLVLDMAQSRQNEGRVEYTKRVH